MLGAGSCSKDRLDSRCPCLRHACSKSADGLVAGVGLRWSDCVPADWQEQLKLTRPCDSIWGELAQSFSPGGWVPKAAREREPRYTRTFPASAYVMFASVPLAQTRGVVKGWRDIAPVSILLHEFKLISLGILSSSIMGGTGSQEGTWYQLCCDWR